MSNNQKKVTTNKAISGRVLLAMEHILKNFKKYRVENMKEFSASIGLLQPHLIAIRDEEKRNVTLYNVHLLVSNYDINADWVLTGRGNMLTETAPK